MTASAAVYEVAHAAERKRAQRVSGDLFISGRAAEPGRIVAVLSDGLGSGIKARVLAALTATMAQRFAGHERRPAHALASIMQALPVCRERGISYATFTVADLRRDGEVRLVEFDNPRAVLLRDGRARTLPAREETMAGDAPYPRRLRLAGFTARPGDRLVVCTDGVTQAGMGSPETPLGWGEEGLHACLEQAVAAEPEIDAATLAATVTRAARRQDGGECRDDITCAVMYRRAPRALLVVSGPPITPERDRELAQLVRGFSGTRIACGGTTAGIIARELGTEVAIDLGRLDHDVPPCGTMPGFALVTEGIVTLARALELLEAGAHDLVRDNGATRLVRQLLAHDRVQFVVGTRLNDRHYDPGMPVDLEARRAVVRRLKNIIERDFLKEAELTYL